MYFEVLQKFKNFLETSYIKYKHIYIERRGADVFFFIIIIIMCMCEGDLGGLRV